MKWLYIIIIFAIGIIMLLLTYVKINIQYRLSDSNDLIITIKYMSSLFNTEIRPFDKKKTDIEKASKTESESKTLLTNNINEFKEIVEYTFNKIIIDKLNWETKIGYLDAFYLSIIYGCIWWIKSVVKGLIFFNKEIKSFNMNVVPIYNTNLLDISFNCIIKIRMVYIINIWIRILKLYKGGEQCDRTSNRRVNEYYNE